MIYVKPTANMQIKPGRHVDTSGRIYLPYLHEWKHVCDGLLCCVFCLRLDLPSSTVRWASVRAPSQRNWSDEMRTWLSLWSDMQQQQQPFNGRLSGTTRVGRYQKKHSPAHTHPGQRTSFITFRHLQWSAASSLFSLRAWQFSRTTSFQILFGLPLGMHFFTQSSSSTCKLFAYSPASVTAISKPHLLHH